MKNLKALYDAAQTAEARLQDVLARIDTLLGEGKRDEAKALKPELDQARTEAKEANDFYLSARDATGGSDPIDPMNRVLLAGDGDLTIGMSQKELQGYSILRMIRGVLGMQNGDQDAVKAAGLEMEASRAMADKLGRSPKGFFVPWDVMINPVKAQGGYLGLRNSQRVADPTTGGYLVQTELLAQSFIDVLRNKMMCRQAGAQVLTGLVGDIDIPKKTAASTAYWLGEGSSPTKSTLTFGSVAGRPRTVGAYSLLGRKLIKQSSLDVEMMFRDDLATTLAIAIDAAGLHGSGAANQPRGIAATPGIGSVAGGTNGAAPTWANIVSLETEVAVDNADIQSLSYMTNAKVRGKLKSTLITATYGDVFIWKEGPTPLNGYPAYVTNQVSSTLTKGNQSLSSAIFFGNWSDLVFLFWGGLDVLVDPYTNSTNGDVLITALQDADVIVRRAESFAAMLDALTA